MGKPAPEKPPLEANALRQAALQALELRNTGCAACRLRPGCSGVVVAEGPPDAPLVIIGEGPGREEDRVGRPFVGQGGELLDRILASAGIERGEAYLTNVVKCRAPGNRTPRPAEVEVCTALWLDAQLALLRPRVILALGNTASQHLLRTGRGVASLRGQWFGFNHADGEGGSYAALLMPMFHPAYLLRNAARTPGSPKALTWRDIREVAAVLRGEKEPDELAQLTPPEMEGQPGLF
ncbi:uracil-DNA glycosylase [Deinococcus sp. ZS9-10]|uniref:Type-4 uracil-DNA glycosylase n=1 Tax=Deinococcus arenicola TaxID=2994950 RepID=A0ABU4DNG4_9DEIO|nr:uracil-DNA glycosylase [Deinococcus sp. ZS9-10]MDV6373977.1 uracil-DNA glycosylase [Deinococcus sp. ZS9-10]